MSLYLSHTYTYMDTMLENDSPEAAQLQGDIVQLAEEVAAARDERREFGILRGLADKKVKRLGKLLLCDM